ncbi:E3 ubiquitin-protein ligase Siah1-like [Centruroides sculpturatus]|uniref:E3 ubiquitin-protein ligase Siah1-like n=1 Tax=Centruroides sculpturatus TaxID=218467 RepID=UPI000C6EF86F|nr:E3 ubiquitin-protein ligase Siah1-like [Centruroides sculpturatus]
MAEGRRTPATTTLANIGRTSTTTPITDPTIVTMFECPVCYEYMSPPIHQCQAGHLVCSKCRERVQRCPVCRGVMDRNRNLVLERLSEKIAFPCKYRDNGCNESRLLQDRQVHERYCPFKTCSCPSLETCRWEGTYQQIIGHITERHSTMINLKHDTVRMIIVGSNLHREFNWTTRLYCYYRHFIIQVIKTKGENNSYTIYVIIRIVGNRRDATRFIGRIEIIGKGRRILWESIPRIVTGNTQHIVSTGDCWTLPLTMLERMLENGMLTVIVTIIPSKTSNSFIRNF